MFNQTSSAVRSSPDQESGCVATNAFFSLLPDRRIRLSLAKKTLSPATRHAYFKNGIFEVSEPFDLPASLLKSLGLDFYRIQPGHYAVFEDARYLIIDF